MIHNTLYIGNYMLFLKNISVRSFGSDQVYISVVGMSRVEFSEVSTINLCFIMAKVDDQCLRFDLSQTNFILESGQETPTACRRILYPSLPCCWITLFYWVKIFALTFWYQFVWLDHFWYQFVCKWIIVHIWNSFVSFVKFNPSKGVFIQIFCRICLIS